MVCLILSKVLPEFLCLTYIFQHNFTFPWGGFGTIFSKALIEKIVLPLYCPSNDSNADTTLIATTTRELTNMEFKLLACERVGQNIMGESFLFQQGMSVADLMHQYVTNWHYTNAEQNWGPVGGPGFCMHADWVLGYFINTYFLAKHTGSRPFLDHADDRLRAWRGSCMYAGASTVKAKNSLKECNNDGDEKCFPEAHFCHHVSPQKMKEMNTVHSTKVGLDALQGDTTW